MKICDFNVLIKAAIRGKSLGTRLGRHFLSKMRYTAVQKQALFHSNVVIATGGYGRAHEGGGGGRLNLKSCILHYKFIFCSMIYFKDFFKIPIKLKRSILSLMHIIFKAVQIYL